MTRSSRTTRSNFRSGLRSLFGRGRSGTGQTSAAALARAAGANPEPAFEALENRQLLFSMTITDVDPFTGVGTVGGTFGYTIPQLLSPNEPGTSQVNVVTEDFNQDFPGAPGTPAAVVTTGTTFQSNMRIQHNANVILVGANSQNQLQATVSGGQSVSWQRVSATNGTTPIPMRFFIISIGGPNGLDFANTTVELILDGEVVTSYSATSNPTLASVSSTGLATGRFTFQVRDANGNVDPDGAFDTIRFVRSAGAPAASYTMDDIAFSEVGGVWTQVVQPRIFGATFRFTGPLGATIQFLDLYGREMRLTTLLGPIPGTQILLVDPNDDGKPNWNDGIGRINISGVDDVSAFTIVGGTLDENGVFTLVDDPVGNFDDMQSAGMGFTLTGTPPRATGMPPGVGSVIIGSPWVRNQANYNPGGLPPGVAVPVTSGFVRADQGIFVLDGSDMSSVYVHGMVFGSSRFNGFVDRITFGVAMGSVSVTGDLGAFIVGGDAGMWVDDDGAPTVKTSGQLHVGRTVGEVSIAGRSLMNVTVVGDLNSPSTRPARDIYRYYEKEWSPNIGTNPDPVTMVADVLNNNNYASLNKLFGGFGIFFGRISQASAYGESFLANDTINSAEWIGSIATAVQINGELGANDPVQTRQDPGDVYGFAVDGTQDIVVQWSGPLSATAAFVTYARIVDQDGRTVAASEFLAGDRRRAVGLRYRPNGPGVYYLVVNTRGDDTNVTDVPYVVTLSGMTPTALGAHRTGAGTGDVNGALGNSINVMSGSVGSVRVGTGYIEGGGEESGTGAIFNARAGLSADDQNSLGTSTISIAGALYSIHAGGDIEGGAGTVVVNVGKNFGTIVTGQRGLAATNGDLRNFNLTVGGSIAMMDIRGAMGVDQDPPPLPKAVDLAGSVFVRTGTDATLNGDVGFIRVGSYVGGGTFSLRTPNNSTVGGLLVQQDLADNGTIYNGIYGGTPGPTGVDMQLGTNSDLRFFDTPRIWQQSVPGVTTALVPGAPVTFTDDGGGQVRIQVIGGNANAGGTVKVVPIGGSLGVAVGRIEVNLDGGARLQITGLGANLQDVISIGRIVVTGADAASSIGIDGTTQVDVWRIVQTGGDAFDEISNITPMGDIVAIDVAALNDLEIRTGDLGRTQMIAWGPRRISPFLGIEEGTGGDVGDTIQIPGAVMTPHWNGELYRPTNDSDSRAGESYLDDVGSPVDPYLDGLIVRTGNITSVLVGGAVGDVIAQAGDIVTVRANADNTTPGGRFDGVFGTIYANRISLVNIGDGLLQRDPAPLSTSGIFANDDILSVVGDRPGAFISSTINAANSVPGNNTPGNFPTDGIDSVTLSGGGSYVDAWIGSMSMDDFWTSFYADDGVYTGTLNRLIGTDANLLRSTVFASFINTIRLTGGFYDASDTHAANNIDTIEAVGYRNSSITGGDLEFHLNTIESGGDIRLITTFGRAGDIEDLTIDALGRIGEVSANNITRSTVDADISLALLKTVGSLRGSAVTAGLLTLGDIGASIRSSNIDIAGPIVDLKAGDGITNTRVRSTGPDGRIDKITAREVFTGSVYSAGPIDTIEVTEGDLAITITTVVNQRGAAGNVKLLKAARDLDLRADIGGTVDEMVAGRHLGNQFNPGVILVHGDVKNVDVSGGQLYADLRVGQKLLKAVIGTAVNLPTGSNLGRGSIIAYGRIEEVTINGDFAGQILSSSGGIGVVTINDGSLLAAGSITALDGNLNNVVINRGHLLGSVHADYTLFSIRLNGSDDGVFGDIGVNPNLSSGTAYSATRNQLPPGVIANSTVQGPSITAGYNIGRIILTNGSIFEAFIFAQRAIGTIDVTGDITQDNLTPGNATVIAAGSSIFLVHAAGSIANTDILAGVRSFGADGRPGGTGADADVMQSGRITTVRGDGNGSGVNVAAGMDPGADGLINTGDELVVLGISYVREVTFGGAVAAGSVKVYADSPTLTVSPGVVRAGTGFQNADPDLHDGSAVGTPLVSDSALNFTWGGVSGTILLSGPGQAYWDQTTGRVLLVNTKLTTNLTVTAGGTLSNFSIVSNDDASVGLVQVVANLAGNSRIVIDAYALGIQTGNVSGNTAIRVGMNVRNITTGTFDGGTITAAFWARDIVIGGTYGTPGAFGETRMDILAGNSIAIAGGNSGLINVDRDLGALAVGGAMSRAQFRAGNSLGAFSAASMSETRFSVGDNLGPVTVAGDVSDTAIQAGGDLGADVLPGGTGFDADRATTGTIAKVDIGGNFQRSSIIAGALRGADGYFGTADDNVAPGRSTVGDVKIGGTLVGSNLNTEQFRIYTTGPLGAVTIGGQAPANTGNFRVQTLATDPTPLRVVDLVIGEDSNTWTATFFFNQAMDESTFGPALTISEVRSGGLVTIPLVQGVDYTIRAYNPVDNSITVDFLRTITDRNLIPDGGVPLPQSATPGSPDPALAGPGVYRFHLSSEVLRAQVVDARLDGDANGFAASNEDFSQDEVVGDAGDKFSPEVINTSEDPLLPNLIDIYGPADLDVVLDNNLTPDGAPDTNRVRTIRGVIGDHPDNDVNIFRVGGDTDIYKITLQAGQILRLGRMDGSAQLAQRLFFNAAGELQSGASADSLLLPAPPIGDGEFTTAEAYLIKTTGTYFIVITNAENAEFFVSGEIPNVEPGAGNTGDYRFTIEVFDDSDSGFAAGTNAGNGTAVVDAPNPIVFAGGNGVFQNPGDPTYDDLSIVTIGNFKFFLDPGADGVRGTADDIVTGTNDAGITSTRQGTTLTSTINSAIGPRGHSGVPGDVASDVDIYHLNNGQTIAAGHRITIKIKLADLGADLGSFSQLSFTDFRGDVQFGVFDTTNAASTDDATLVLSPTDFLPIAGKPGQLASQGTAGYGFDENGDFFITFITPGRIGGTAAEPATYAVYLQGVFNTDYTIEVTQTADTTLPTTPQTSQNIFLETRGGVIGWLEAGGLTTTLAPYAASVLGFTGAVGGMPVDQYILTNVVSTLQSIFASTGLNVNFSTNPNAFEFQDYSTVFLTTTQDPISIINTDNYGYSQHSDPFNLDKNDEAVVFLPSLAQLAYTPSQADVDEFVLSLAAAIGRRTGELMGLRMTANASLLEAPQDIMGANSVFQTPLPGNTYGFPSTDRALSNGFDTITDTNFFLGRQNAFALLDKFLTP